METIAPLGDDPLAGLPTISAGCIAPVRDRFLSKKASWSGDIVKSRKFYRPYVKPVTDLLRKIKGTHVKRATNSLKFFCHRPAEYPQATVGLSVGEDCRDDEIVRRIVAAYKASNDERSNPSNIWEGIYDSQQAPLHGILVGDDFEAIRTLLRRPGDSALFYGFEGGFSVGYEGLIGDARRKVYRDHLVLVPHDYLLRLAEIIGAFRFENLERKSKGYEKLSSDVILSAIERRLGLELQFPNPFPDECGTQTARGIMTYRAVHAVYQAWRIRELLKRVPAPRVLEIGGGLGRTAFYAWQMGIKDYTIVDLPFTGVSQGYYLMRTLGEDNVLLNGEKDDRHPTMVKVLQPGAFLDSDRKYDLILNVDSFPEMSREVAESYWNHIRQVTPTFLSINQEAESFTVQDMADADAAHIHTALRYPSGLRKGYAEELFTFR